MNKGIPIISVEHVTVAYGDNVVLNDISLTVDKGDFITITGPNGGGKTSLLKVMLRLQKPAAGKVVYLDDGHPVKTLPIGYLPQKSMIDSHFPITVQQTVCSGMMHGIFGRLPSDAALRLERAAQLTGISHILGQPIGSLSGGQLQRTLFARALITNPRVLILDEPLSYVDKSFESQIYDLLASMAGDVTIILVSHEMSGFRGIANRQLFVNHTIRTIKE